MVLIEVPQGQDQLTGDLTQKGWDDDISADVLMEVRDALQRAQKDGHVVQDFGLDGCLWRRV
jgi:hypothetical protein